ncbi:MAG: ABC transporter permease [Acidimicrobiales bacterium]
MRRIRVLERPVTLVARREVIEGTRSKGFWILLAVSVAAVAALILVWHFAAQSGGSVTTLAVVGDAPGPDTERLDQVGDAIGTRIEIVTVPTDEAARAAISTGDADVAILDEAAVLVTDEPVDPDDDSKLAAVVNVLRADIALAQGLDSAGLSETQAEAVLGHDPPAVESLRGEPDSAAGSRVGVAIAMNIMLFLLLQTYGGWVISGVTREKASRVVEVLLSTVTARQLMFGKIIGVGMIALIHAVILVTTALVMAAVVGIDVPDGFRTSDVVVGAVWFLLGYALYCCAFAATGSLCSRAEDAQGAVLPLMVPLVAGYIIAFSAFDGASPLLWVLSFFPPTAVLCMPVLSATGAAPPGAVLASMAVTAAAAYAMARLAAAIYSRSILKTGKRVSWREALGRAPAAPGDVPA